MDESKQYICTISYQTPTPPVSLATYKITSPLTTSTPTSMKHGDTIRFRFQPSPAQALPTQARLLVGYKKQNANKDTSPFLNDANGIDILSHPVLTIGDRNGTWGFAVLFTVETATDSHFFFLPDPEIIVGPEIAG